MSNLVLNGDFSSPTIASTTTTYYTTSPPTNWNVTNSIYYGGVGQNGIVKLYDSSNNYTTYFSMNASVYFSQNITFSKADYYTFSFLYSYKTNPNPNTTLQVNFGQNDVFVSKTIQDISNVSWTRYSFTFYVNSSQINIPHPLKFRNATNITNYNSTDITPEIESSQMYLKDVSIVPYTPPCFREGTFISCLKDGVDMEIPVEKLNEYPYLVKTLNHGYLPIHSIGKGIIYNPGNRERIKGRLYKLTPQNYPEIYTPLYITSCHGILVPSLTETEIQSCREQYEGNLYITDGYYRLFACLDDRAEPFDQEGHFNIYHIALHSDDVMVNYGIYANGLLVESCCIWSLTEKHKQMDLIVPTV